MCLFHLLGLCFDGVTDSLLLLSSCCFAFGCLEHNLLSVQLVSCACMVWICCLLSSSFSFFWCVSSVCVVFFLSWVLVCFLSILIVILGFSFLHCSVLMLLLHFMSWLLVCVCVFSWAAFWGEPWRKIVWIWPTGRGQYIFRVFS